MRSWRSGDKYESVVLHQDVSSGIVTTPVASMSLESLMDAVGDGVRAEMAAYAMA
jgi:hypothetical protein